MKQLPIEITNEQVSQELDMWFNNEECEALARETGFILPRGTGFATPSQTFDAAVIFVP